MSTPTTNGQTHHALYVCGAAEDLELLARYLAITTKSLPFDIERALGGLSLLLEQARLLGQASARLQVSAEQADAFRAALEREATRLATLGDGSLSAMLRRISFEI